MRRESSVLERNRDGTPASLAAAITAADQKIRSGLGGFPGLFFQIPIVLSKEKLKINVENILKAAHVAEHVLISCYGDGRALLENQLSGPLD